MAHEKSKQQVVDISSSSDELKLPWSESHDDDAEEISSSTSCFSEDEDKVEVGGDADSDIDDVEKLDAESMYNKVIQLIRGRSDLRELKLNECKSYLRRHNLRLSGSKEECIQRIKEHWKLKDGNGEVFYPRSSFKIDCTGDVCKGDIVLFHQKVHQMSGNMARNKTVGRRTVAGRVIKESYGATRQQHTFTVEVFWSRGIKKLDPLFPLLVKGRNLYKMRTFRQLWKNENERKEVLAEKHRRGDAARSVRDMRRAKTAMRLNEHLAFKGDQHRKRSHHLGPSRILEKSSGSGKKSPNEHGKVAKNKKMVDSHRFAPYNSKPNAGSRGYAPYRRHHNPPDKVRQYPSSSYTYPAQNFNHFNSDVFPTDPHNLYPHGGFASRGEFPYSLPLPYSSTRPTSQWQEISHGSSLGPSYSHSNNGNYPRLRGSYQHNTTTERHGWK